MRFVLAMEHDLAGLDTHPATIARLHVAAGEHERDIALRVAVARHPLEGAMNGEGAVIRSASRPLSTRTSWEVALHQRRRLQRRRESEWRVEAHAHRRSPA